MNGTQILNLEAAKLVKEWAAWMVTVQSAAIGFLIVKAASISAVALHVALLAFCLSVIAAAWNLSALPWIVLRLDTEKDPNIYKSKLSTAPVLNLVPLWVMLAIQHWAFAIGVISLVWMRLRM